MAVIIKKTRNTFTKYSKRYTTYASRVNGKPKISTEQKGK
jgi:hypothetical protein